MYALWLWYHGAAFAGYQCQPGKRTIQHTLEQALRKADLTRSPVAAGRTDAGVHARMQVVSLREFTLSPSQVQERLRDHLPDDLGVVAVRRATRKFNARWASVKKEYRYRLCIGSPEKHSSYAWPVRDVSQTRLREAVAQWLGTRTFQAFHHPSSPRHLRTIESAVVVASGDLLEVRVVGDAFGRHQIRRLIAAAVRRATDAIGEAEYAAAFVEGAPPSFAKAPPHGLIAWDVVYPEDIDPFIDVRATADSLPCTLPFSEVECPVEAVPAKPREGSH